jgi:ketosteroid isomerase-like protein
MLQAIGQTDYLRAFTGPDHAMATVQDEVSATFRQFVAAQNARDGAALTPLLRAGPAFVWVTTSGETVWGRDAALARFRTNWQSQWHLAPDFDALRVVEVAPDAALLHVPVMAVFAPHGQPATPRLVHWSGVFAREAGRWTVAAILLATVP